MRIEEELYSAKEVAKILGLTHHTLAVWRCKKKYPKLKYTKVGGCIRYYKKWVEKFIADNTVGED